MDGAAIGNFQHPLALLRGQIAFQRDLPANPVDLALAFDLVRSANRYLDKIGGKNTPFTGWSVLQFMSIQELLGETIGIFGSSPDEYRRRSIKRQSLARGINVAEVERLIGERREARLSKNFAESDRIRDALSAMGVEIKDRPDGKTDWKIK